MNKRRKKRVERGWHGWRGWHSWRGWHGWCGCGCDNRIWLVFLVIAVVIVALHVWGHGSLPCSRFFGH